MNFQDAQKEFQIRYYLWATLEFEKEINESFPSISSPTMTLASFISLCNWLGLTSMTEWEYLTDEEVQPACNHAIAFSKHFFSSAPKLLKGLEFENLTSNKN